MLRKFAESDRQAVIAMTNDLYSGPSVLHTVPQEYFSATFDECLKDSPYVAGYMIEKDGKSAGYMLLSFTYSGEAGGLTIWVEELYILPGFRDQGLGRDALHFLFKTYPDAKRFRLEVAPENPRAKALYAREGFSELPYIQMTADRA